jgi:hypothetical protein
VSGVLGMLALPGNPYDGHTLAPALAQVQRLSGSVIERAYVGRGYRGARPGSQARFHLRPAPRCDCDDPPGAPATQRHRAGDRPYEYRRLGLIATSSPVRAATQSTHCCPAPNTISA